MKQEKLDIPTWYSLNETHKSFAIDYGEVKFYKPEYCPFGGFTSIHKTKEGIDRYALHTSSFYVVGDKPVFGANVRLQKELICRQMLLDQMIEVETTEPIIELHTHKHKIDLLDLVNLVQPGYFKSKTPDMGSYYGIYRGEKLVAVTGERMKMEAYTEMSAIVTHPQHTRKGYAKQLIAHTAAKIFMEARTPYLHVADTNVTAIDLYEKLGFKTRRRISFWHFITND